MNNLEPALAYASTNQDKNLTQLKEFISIPSISTLTENRDDIRKAAQWLADDLRTIGLQRVEIMETPGHPIVYAESIIDSDFPTMLVYGHYDVQPVDPLDEWESPPFEPAIRGDHLYARGASDMKSQIFAQFKALEALLSHGPLSFNVKYMLEGEEEIGSPNLGGFLENHHEMLKCDFVLNCDSGIHAPDLPSICYALRGLAYFELEVRGPSHDLHSGLFGGVVHNPAQALCELIAGMHDGDGKVTLPGFYDDVRPLTQEERKALSKMPESDEDKKRFTGVSELWGEKGFTPTERIGARPTLEVNGIWGGFTGEGQKTVIPAQVNAKISMRLVPDQTADRVYEQLTNYLQQRSPTTIQWKLKRLADGPGAIMGRDSTQMKAAAAALQESFRLEPVFRREGGSVPVVAHMQQTLGVDTVMLGFELPDDGMHGPNEKQYLPNFFRGIETYIRFMSKL